MTEYDADKHFPVDRLVPPVMLKNTLNVFLGKHNLSQYAASETAKFGHITYYFNGNSYELAPGEKTKKITSDRLPFDTRPWMKSAETTDDLLWNLDQYDFLRINFAGGDMVGHFGELQPTVVALEAIDIQLARIAKAVDKLGGILLITSDHGNAEELLGPNAVPKTSHTTNPVPAIFYDNTLNRNRYRLSNIKYPGLSNIASTISLLLGISSYPSCWDAPLIELLSDF